jgi:hypothetical protein
MPIHDHRCSGGHVFERYVSCDDLHLLQRCECGEPAQRVYLRFPMSFVQKDIHYQSPIDGRPITTKQARLNDLAANDCVEYDPSLKAYGERRRQQEQAALERSIDETVEREIQTMPTRKREKLTAELDGGMDVEVTRQSPVSEAA